MPTLMTLQNLTLSHPHKQLFKDVTFTLNEGDRIGVLGLNGHGKSSLFKVMMGLQAPDTTVPAFICDKNRDLTVFYVPQELLPPGEYSLEDYFYEYYPDFKVGKDRLHVIGEKLSLGEGDFEALCSEQERIYNQLEQGGEPRLHSAYVSYLKGFGVEDMTRPVKGLSGGEQRKLALALGLSCPHQVVLWDEPTNHLDLETIQKFEEELQKCSKTFMIISHDRSLLNNVVDRIVHIQSGKLKSFQGTYAQYLEFLQQEDLRRTKELDRLENHDRRETAWIRRGAKARRTKSKKRIEDYDSLQNSIRDLKAQAHKSVSLNLQSSGRKSKILVQADDISMRFGDRTLFSGVNFKLAKGDKIALMGGNGVGKSTLIKMILEQIKPTSGTLKTLEGLDSGHFSQKRESLPLDKTPWELVGEGIDFVISNTGDKRHVASYLEGFLFRPEEIKRPIHTFSGGEKNRLQLAQFMKHARDLWIFDEPTNDLDLETIGILEEELRAYEGALIIVAHDRTFIENVTDKCWLIHDQELEIFEGGWAQAELFLEAMELEAELKKRTPPAKAANSTVSRLSNKERARVEKIGPELEAQEKLVADLEAKLAKIDYAKTSATKDAEELNAKLSVAQKKLDELFEEWADLESKK
ncbi:MAG: ABC-F family ATP-binding cassette domain-containing protein [Bacteriovoracaceae bacterium]|nr:ABC-F family ATP-binding cassette domain-containing protein [Bacteriovoracaceae bacterium]